MATEWKEIFIDEFTNEMFDPALYRVTYSADLHRFLVRRTTKIERLFSRTRQVWFGLLAALTPKRP